MNAQYSGTVQALDVVLSAIAVSPSAINAGPHPGRQPGWTAMSRYASSPAATLAATLANASTAGRRSSARQATHSEVGGTPRAGTNTVPGRALNASADAGHRPMPRPATMYSRHSSIVRASAPTEGTPPPGRGTASQSSLNTDGTHPSTDSGAATHGSPATSARSSTDREASG